MKKVILLSVIVLAIAGAVYYAFEKSNSPKTNMTAGRAMPAQAVDVALVKQQAVNPEASFVAKIESRDKVALRARITGFLQERLFNEGDVVTAGQPLFRIESVNFEAQVRQAEANLAKAKAAAVNAKAQFDRTKTLFETKDVSAARLDEAQAAHDAAVAAVTEMEAVVDLMKKDLEYTTIVAPMDGKVGEARFSVGELIGPNSGVLAEVVSIDPIDAVFSISENQLLILQEQFGNGADTAVSFVASNGKLYPYPGKIDFVDVALDEAMNTLKIKASFPNPEHRLISGQYGRVNLKGKNPVERVVIPMKAVQRDMSGTYVYLVSDDNQIIKQPIKTGMELKNFDVVVEEGLAGGEKLVMAGFQKIAPHMTVTPIMLTEKGE